MNRGVAAGFGAIAIGRIIKLIPAEIENHFSADVSNKGACRLVSAQPKMDTSVA